MIIKTFEINKKKFDIQKFFLIYGENEGQKKEIIHNLKKNLRGNVESYDETQILNNTEIFSLITNIKGYEKGGMDDDGPGDITPAFLEPGEFVMTRPATRALGSENLYRLMKMAESVA